MATIAFVALIAVAGGVAVGALYPRSSSINQSFESPIAFVQFYGVYNNQTYGLWFLNVTAVGGGPCNLGGICITGGFQTPTVTFSVSAGGIHAYRIAIPITISSINQITVSPPFALGGYLPHPTVTLIGNNQAVVQLELGATDTKGQLNIYLHLS